MVRPANFGFNEQTALTNSFQNKGANEDVKNALIEFDAMVAKLVENGIQVTVIDDTLEPVKPDAIFPNNWFSTHQNGMLITYPMCHLNRRIERRDDIINPLKEKSNTFIDLSELEQQNLFLEGTGSMVIDHSSNVAFAALSARTDADVLALFTEKTGIRTCAFRAFNEQGLAIYHTNVLLAITPHYAIVCMQAIAEEDRAQVIAMFKECNKELVEISFEQMNNFAGNMLCLQNNQGKQFLVLSKSAYLSLSKVQIELFEKYYTLLVMPIHTIETIGGGSVRCMMAELFF